jgi:lipopolysaccharide/colanic/teichoic acid biosynthesis glycosyltransferase
MRLVWRYRRKRLLWGLVVGSSHGLKRALDIVGAGFGLVLLAPLLAITALAVKLDDRGPVFFGQERVGRDAKVFTMYKFRSMRVNAQELAASLAAGNQAGDVLFKMHRDPRVTRVGRVIRKLSIDELPQLANVLGGSMSLVGPRPALPGEVALYDMAQRERLAVKPGITGLWQIGGRSDLDFAQQVRLDLEYIGSPSLRRDLAILVRTVPAVLSGRGAY